MDPKWRLIFDLHGQRRADDDESGDQNRLHRSKTLQGTAVSQAAVGVDVEPREAAPECFTHDQGTLIRADGYSIRKSKARRGNPTN
jgi:hypothetical protein